MRRWAGALNSRQADWAEMPTPTQKFWRVHISDGEGCFCLRDEGNWSGRRDSNPRPTAWKAVKQASKRSATISLSKSDLDGLPVDCINVFGDHRGTTALAVVKITDTFLRSLAPDDERTEYRDSELPGFAVRATAGGAAFSVSFRLQGGRGGRKSRRQIGKFPEISATKARGIARDILAASRLGVDLAGDRQKQATSSLAEVCARFFREQPTTTWRKEQARVMARDVLPVLGSRPAASLSRGEVVSLLDRLVRRAPATAIAARKTLLLIYNWATVREIVPTNPMIGVPTPAEVGERDRVLTPTELRRLWAGLAEYGGVSAAILGVMLFTAQRGGDVRGMREEHVRGDWWVIPKELTKNGKRDHAVYLTESTLALISSSEPEGGYVFPRAGGVEMLNTTPSNAMAKICRRVGIEDATPHDLRRTAATLLSEALARKGQDDWVAALILGHTSGKRSPRVTQIYNRYAYRDEIQEAMLLLEATLLSIL
jgi:integrase